MVAQYSRDYVANVTEELLQFIKRIAFFLVLLSNWNTECIHVGRIGDNKSVGVFVVYTPLTEHCQL